MSDLQVYVFLIIGFGAGFVVGAMMFYRGPHGN